MARALLLSLTLLLLAAPARAAPAAAAECPEVWPQATFLQLYADDPPDRAQRLDHWRDLGLRTLILQWSAYGPPDAGPFPLVDSGRIAAILDAAAERGIEVWVGLRYDPGFWRWHEPTAAPEEENPDPGPAPPLAAYLQGRINDLRPLIERLAPLAAHPAFAGWYIADEVDDRQWNSRSRRLRLGEYLGRLTGLLQAAAPGASIAISGFSDARLPPLEWAELWVELLGGAGIERLLFQDGIGAGKLELEELDYYLPVLAQRLAEAGHGLSVVVELFEPDPQAGRPGTFRPASPARIVEQLQRAAQIGALSSALPPTSFALPHHADPAAGPLAAALSEALQALYRRCGPP